MGFIFQGINNKLLDDSGTNGIYINFPDIKNKLLDDSGTMGFILTFQEYKFRINC